MNKQEILEKAKSHTLKSKKVWISDWECEIVIRQLSAKQYVDLSTTCLSEDKKGIDQSKFLNLAILDSVYSVDGEQVFSHADLETILNMTADGYSTLILAITELNNLDGSAGNKNPKNLKKTT